MSAPCAPTKSCCGVRDRRGRVPHTLFGCPPPLGGCALMARRMLIFRVAPCIAPPPVQTSLGAGGGSITVCPPPHLVLTDFRLPAADLCRDKFSKCGVMATSGLCQTVVASCARSCGGC